MTKEVRLLIVCSAGAGSSQLLKINLEKVIKELGYEGIQTAVSDIGTCKSVCCDAIISTEYNSDMILDHPTARCCTTVKGIFDFISLKEKLNGLLEELGYLNSRDENIF